MPTDFAALLDAVTSPLGDHISLGLAILNAIFASAGWFKWWIERKERQRLERESAYRDELDRIREEQSAKEQSDAAELDTAILTLILKFPRRVFSVEEIADIVGASEDSTRASLARLVRARYIEPEGSRYRAPRGKRYPGK